MNPIVNSLLDMARKMRRELPDNNPERLREAIEASLLPIVRCALRTGAGHPHVVSWVRDQAAKNPAEPRDLARAAPPIARALCECMLERMDPLSGRETIFGP